MNIGILKETLDHESRVAITPDIAKKLISNGHTVNIESSAGEKSFFSDQDYIDTGCTIEKNSKDIYNCDLILKVNAFNDNDDYWRSHC